MKGHQKVRCQVLVQHILLDIYLCHTWMEFTSSFWHQRSTMMVESVSHKIQAWRSKNTGLWMTVGQFKEVLGVLVYEWMIKRYHLVIISTLTINLISDELRTEDNGWLFRPSSQKQMLRRNELLHEQCLEKVFNCNSRETRVEQTFRRYLWLCSKHVFTLIKNTIRLFSALKRNISEFYYEVFLFLPEYK